MKEEKALKPPNQTDCKLGRHHKPSPHSNQTIKDHWSRGVRIEYKKLTFRREKIIAFSAVITNLTEQQQQQLDLDRSQQLSASPCLITGYLLPSSIMQASWIPSSKICQLACLFYLACKLFPTIFFIMLYFILFISTLERICTISKQNFQSNFTHFIQIVCLMIMWITKKMEQWPPQRLLQWESKLSNKKNTFSGFIWKFWFPLQ